MGFSSLLFTYFEFVDGYESSSLTSKQIEEFAPDFILLLHSPMNNYGRKESFEYDLK